MTITTGAPSLRASWLCKGVPFETFGLTSPPALSSCHCPRQKRRHHRWLLRSAPAMAEAQSQSSDAWDDEFGDKYGQLQFASVLEQGNREDMQDFLAVNQKARHGYLYAGVFDGHGGETAADYLSKNLYKVFTDGEDGRPAAVAESTENSSGSETGQADGGAKSSPDRLTDMLKAAFKKMDEELLHWLETTQEGEEAVSGSTATVVLARKDKIMVANVGDSRAVLSRNGQPYDLSSEHRVMGKGKTVEDEISRVKSVGGWISDGRVCDILAVSRAFGDPQFKGSGLPSLLEFGIEGGFWDEKFAQSVSFSGDPVIAAPDVIEITVKEDDEFIILASDGLWDVMSSKEAVTFARKDLQKGRSLQAVVEKLANIAVRRYSTDNIAVVLIDLGGGKEGWGKKKTGWSLFGA